MSERVTLKRALISVSDKTGIVEFASALQSQFGVELLSTGGTASALRQAGLTVRDVSELTGFPEMMDGRIKTLHPKVHGGLLAVRDNPQHAAAMQAHGIVPIDLVCINLYPFEQTIAKPRVALEEAIENIDIGGPSMVRSAAKNHRYVLVATSPAQYGPILQTLRENHGTTDYAFRLAHAAAAFALTSQYDTAIAAYMATQTGPAEALPPRLTLSLKRRQSLRYGENPHQPAALYVDRQPAEASVAFATQLHGKELSYINLLDADAALAAVKELEAPGACIVKHATPCGFAVGADAVQAFERAYAGDPLAAFGGILALNRPVDLRTAQALTSAGEGKWFVEVMVAPSFAADALELLKNRWKNVRLLEVGDLAAGGATRIDPAELHMHKIVGGYLVQQRDLAGADPATWKVVSKRPPTAREIADLKIAWLACKHIKSNAVAIATGGMLVGAGAGQQDRVSSCRIAITKAAGRATGGVAASDAFFPFADGPQLLLDAGITAIIHPGGSVRDQDTLDLCDQRGAALILTGQRHFRH
jgi:phosphoribosylaminoimidazolecarboxamide formyltransferase/IMP cyclohydrolase